MGNANNNMAIEEFLQAKCEEITNNSQQCKFYDQKASRSFLALKKSLGPAQIKLLLEYEGDISAANMVAEIEIYKAVLNNKLNTIEFAQAL